MTNLPISGQFTIAATYGQKGKYWANGHKGLDIVSSNKTIYATCDGIVRVVAFDPNGWGNYVSIGDAEGRRHIFCHLAPNSIKVVEGQKVNHSTIIGTMGTTGNSTGVHLHYQINNTNGNDINPCPYLGVPNEKGTYNSADYEIDTFKYTDDAKIASWAKDEVYELHKRGIMVGDKNNRFNPTNSITRQEIAVAVKNAITKCGLNFANTGNSNKYVDDAKIASWAKDEVYFLKLKEIMIGSNNKFNPKNNITRQEVAVLLNNVYNTVVNIKGIPPYSDDKKIASWAKTAVYILKAIKIMVGSNNLFKPTNTITRQEVAVAIVNLIKKLGK